MDGTDPARDSAPEVARSDEAIPRYLRALTRATSKLASRADSAAVLQGVVESLCSEFDAAGAVIWLPQGPGVALVRGPSAAPGLAPRPPGVSPPAFCPKVEDVARSRRAFVQNGISDPAFDSAWVAREGLAAVAVIPLAVGEHLHGVLVHFTRGRICALTAEILASLAAMVAVYLERESLAQELVVSREESARVVETAEGRLRMVIAHAPIILFALDSKGIITLSVGRGLEPLGVEPNQNVGRSVFDLYASASDVIENTRRALAGEELTAQNWIGPALFETRLRPIRDRAGEVQGVIGVSMDVTDRTRALRTLEHERRDQQTILDSVPAMMIFFKDDKNQTLRVNKAAAAAQNMTPEEFIAHRTEELYPEEAASYHQDDLEVIRSGKPKLGIVEPHLVASGEKRWVRTDKIPYRDETGKTVGVVVFALDITPLKRAEEALSAEKERLAVTLSSIGDGVIATDTRGRVVLVNRVAEELTGWSQEAASGRPVAEVLKLRDPKTGEPLPDPVAAILATGTCPAGATQLALLETRSGGQRLVADRGSPIRREGSTVEGAVVVLRDMTETKRLEDELLRIAKLESIGLLAAGIAHDFNNILTAITANVSLAKLSLRPRDEAFALLGEVEEAALRARELTHQLLVFAKGGAPIKRTTVIAGLVRDSTGFALRGSNVRGDVSIAPDLWPVEVDEAQLGQVIHNLVLNAQQAMPAGGVVSVRAENVVVDARDRQPLAPGRYVRLAVSDTGQGIAPENLPRIFDPFFTTKPGGTGLGLTTTFSIVQRHGGQIACRSKLGEGTTFEIHLPASSRPIAGDAPVVQPAPRGRGRVLVLDDEQRIRSVVGQILGHLGYEADFARDGSEAVERYDAALKAGQRFDAVLMDLTIPGGMGGREAMERILAIDPHARGIVSSGYSNDPVMSEHARHGFKGLIAKPYRLEDLGRVLQRVLEG